MPLLYDPIRERLKHLVRRDREDLAGLSRMLGRAPGYLGDFLKRGTPKVLPAREREALAAYFKARPADLMPQARAGAEPRELWRGWWEEGE